MPIMWYNNSVGYGNGSYENVKHLDSSKLDYKSKQNYKSKQKLDKKKIVITIEEEGY